MNGNSKLKQWLIFYPLVFAFGAWLGSLGLLKSGDDAFNDPKLAKEFAEMVQQAETGLGEREAKMRYTELQTQYANDVKDQCFIVEYMGRKCEPHSFKSYLRDHGYKL